MSTQISEERLESLLRASSPYPPDQEGAPSLREQRMIGAIVEGRSGSARLAVTHRRSRILAATVAVASVAIVLVGVVSALTVLPSRQFIAAPSVSASTAPALSASPVPETPATDPTAAGRKCNDLAYVGWQEQDTEWKQVATGVPFDGGEREGAMGTADLNADGRPIGYTVAAGDAPYAIGDRFCISGIAVLHFNGYWVTGDGKDIAPGDYLYLSPDPAVSNPNLWAPGTRGP